MLASILCLPSSHLQTYATLKLQITYYVPTTFCTYLRTTSRTTSCFNCLFRLVCSQRCPYIKHHKYFHPCVYGPWMRNNLQYSSLKMWIGEQKLTDISVALEKTTPATQPFFRWLWYMDQSLEWKSGCHGSGSNARPPAQDRRKRILGMRLPWAPVMRHRLVL